MTRRVARSSDSSTSVDEDQTRIMRVETPKIGRKNSEPICISAATATEIDLGPRRAALEQGRERNHGAHTASSISTLRTCRSCSLPLCKNTETTLVVRATRYFVRVVKTTLELSCFIKSSIDRNAKRNDRNRSRHEVSSPFGRRVEPIVELSNARPKRSHDIFPARYFRYPRRSMCIQFKVYIRWPAEQETNV